MQWGTFVSTRRADRVETLSFPTSFKNTCYQVHGIQRIAAPSNSSGGNIQIKDTTLTSVTLWFDCYTDSIDYIAIGK